MDAYLNELSCPTEAQDVDEARRKVATLIQTLKTAYLQGFKKVRCHEHGFSAIQISAEYTLDDFCREHAYATPEALFLMSHLCPPYFAPDSDQETLYVTSAYRAVLDEDTLQYSDNPYGLVSAYLNQSVAINFDANPHWHRGKWVQLSVTSPEGVVQQAQVLTLTHAAEFSAELFEQWQVDHTPRQYRTSQLLPQQKECRLSSDHHGNRELKQFAEQRLFPLPYIDGVVTSRSYQPHASSFVVEIFPQTMRLTVCLYWTTPGFCMLVQTTATNPVELRQMAADLNQKFGKN